MRISRTIDFKVLRYLKFSTSTFGVWLKPAHPFLQDGHSLEFPLGTTITSCEPKCGFPKEAQHAHCVCVLHLQWNVEFPVTSRELTSFHGMSSSTLCFCALHKSACLLQARNSGFSQTHIHVLACQVQTWAKQWWEEPKVASTIAKFKVKWFCCCQWLCCTWRFCTVHKHKLPTHFGFVLFQHSCGCNACQCQACLFETGKWANFC